MQKMDKSIINSMNRINILEVLWENASVFRAEIARMTNLSHPTVMKIIDDLVAQGLVTITGKGISNGGKPPLMLELNQDFYYSFGVDINEYRIEILLVNLRLKVIDKRIQDNRVTDTPDTILQRVVTEIQDMIRHNPQCADRILGIGIGIPGLVNAQRGFVIHSSELNWENIDAMAYLRDAFQGTILIDESTRAFAMGEKLFGYGKKCKNFFCISLGSGIGSALVVDGKLYYGELESSGQLGHMSVEKDGKKCVCGNYGCLELYASGKVMEEQAKNAVLKETPTMIGDLVYGKVDKIDINIVFEAAENGDETAIHILQQAADYLGMAIAGAVNLIAPELIIFEGKISRTGPLFMQMVEKALDKRNMRLVKRNIQLVTEHDKSCTVALGAAAFLIEGFIKNGARENGSLKLTEHEETSEPAEI